MIVPMQKIHVVARSCDRQAVLEALRELGVIHLVPVDPAQAVLDEDLSRQVQAAERALQVLQDVAPRGTAPALQPREVIQEVLEIERRAAEGRSRLAVLYHELEQLSDWGELRLQDLFELRKAGIAVEFFRLPRQLVGQIRAECVEVVNRLPGGQVIVAVARKHQAVQIPEEAVPVPWPTRDCPSIRAEAAQIEAQLKRDVERLHELAHGVPKIRRELFALQAKAEERLAVRGALTDENLFALQGWVPAEVAPSLAEQLAARGLPAAVEMREPLPDEQPPTLIRPPKWAQPIEGLFRILGTVPGYREFDVSVPFLIALPIFTAMLISDGGYGALILLGCLIFYRGLTQSIGERFTQLMMLIGGACLVWGVLTASFFGFTPYPPLVSVDLSERSRSFLMRLSFAIGTIHLSTAQAWQAVRLYPDLRFLSKVGWALFICGMYGVVNMFVLKDPFHWQTPWPYLLLLGATLAIVFAHPDRNLLNMLGLGFASFPLAMLSAFSDVISYVRLMAVGLASSVLGASFNAMALAAGSWPVTALLMILAHGLNMALALVAMFAHGVRLNMLEFSNNLGMMWNGYAYRPFQRKTLEESSA